VPLFDVLNNPQLLMDNLKRLIDSFCEYKGVDFKDLIWDKEGDWGNGCWVDYDDNNYC
jgi:hypothetical protein